MSLRVKYIGWAGVFFGLCYSVYADMHITLHNGQTDTLPVKENEIASIEYKKNRLLKGPLKSSVKYSKKLGKRIFQAGPSYMFATPGEISKLAADGSIVEIEAGIYSGDVTVWTQDNITLRGVGGRVHLQANGKAAEHKAIWVIKGNNVVIENIEFSGAKVTSRNGAGIRMEGRNLILRNCHFHDNEMGILTGKNPTSEITIENSEFNNNTVNYGQFKSLGHNIYIGEIAKFTLTGSYIHDAETGHNVKSRAHENYILYNRITDEKLGSSYLLDIPNGGNAFIIGNIFHQNSINDNFTLLSFSAERNQTRTSSSLYVVNNTFVNSAKDAIFIQNHGAGSTTLLNNLFVGPGKITQKPKDYPSNIQLLATDFVDKESYDYRLKQTAGEVINQGVIPGVAKNGFLLNPQYQYLHPASTGLRPVDGGIDIGAYEFVPPIHE